VSDSQKDWDEHVSYALGAYRATKHSATGFSPNYLVFGRELASLFEIMFPGIPGVDDIQDQNHGDYVATLKDRFRKSYTIVRENLKAVAFRNKRKYDQRVKKQVKYHPGEWVWVFYPRRVQGRTPKWQRYCDGPFLVLEVIGDVNYRVQQSAHSEKQVVHVDKLKTYLGKTPLSWPGPPALPGVNDTPTPPELTFDDEFFENLPESYEPWTAADNPGDSPAQADDDIENAVSLPPGDASDEEDGVITEDGSDSPSALPVGTINRPRQTVIKPARFCIMKEPEDKPGQVHSTVTVDKEDLVNEPKRINSAPQPTVERLESVILVDNTPEIDFEFGEEPTIEITSFY